MKNLKIKLEELNIDDITIEEIIDKMNNQEKSNIEGTKESRENELKDKLKNTESSQEKVVIAAKIISLNLK